MKKELHEFFRPSDDDFKRLWDGALISFDAAALLNLYRYSPTSSQALMDVIRNYEKRIRLPFQFAHEGFAKAGAASARRVANAASGSDGFGATSGITRGHVEYCHIDPVKQTRAREAGAGLAAFVVSPRCRTRDISDRLGRRRCCRRRIWRGFVVS